MTTTNAGTQGGRSIRTPDQRLRVFVSSTLEELARERAAVRGAIEQLRLTPVMFELGARPHPPRALYRAYIEQSEVFVGIYWQRSGWVAPNMEISGIEDEYRLSGDRPRLIYVKQPAPALEPRLTNFIHRVQEEGLASYKRFKTPEELHEVVLEDLALLLSEAFGWPYGSSPKPQEPQRLPPLPVPLTRLVDRERELREISTLLRDQVARLVTITGAGGTGKTRLALEAARQVEDTFVGGAAFVDLSPVTEADRFIPTLADALGVSPEGRRPIVESIVESLSRRPPLLLLDNFEQVVQAAPQVASLLATCPDASALVTSRVPLHVRGEREYRAMPLPTSEALSGARLAEIAAAPATQLFTERAADAMPGFALTAENAGFVAEICRRLDGLPLALELAAARIRVLTPQALLERLDSRLDLPRGAADMPKRQRTLRAAIAWSHELLQGPERALFAQLAQFAGGFTLEAVEAVCAGEESGNIIDTLSSLVEKNLVVPDMSTGLEPRFRMLETIREFALEQLAGRDDRKRLEQRYAAYYVGLCEAAKAHLHGRDQAAWFARLDADLGNLETVVAWARRTGEHELIIRAWASTMLYWWVRRSGGEMLPIVEEIVSLPQGVPTKTRGAAAWLLGTCRVTVGDRDGSRRPLREALECARAAGDLEGMVLSLGMLGAVAEETTGPDGAQALQQEALEIARDLEWRWGIAYALHHLGDTAVRDRDSAALIAIDAECLAIARELENEPMATIALCQLGWGHLMQEEYPQARESLAESATGCIRLRSNEYLSYCLDGFAGLAAAAGDARIAARLAGAADSVREVLRVVPFPPLARMIAELRAPARDALGEETFEAERAAGADLDAEDALSLVLGDD